ncbi:MAG: hypothetical protein WA775_03610 [Psychroserpens sp.]|uniref:hypothetical protein n=1 Tax=Psychroserpens sp. TaxID=2020870 RepID=UPI003CB330D5
MKNVFGLILGLLLSQFSAFAQSSVNDYKYIIVPKQFDFQKSENQYQLNELTKFLFNKYGYEAYIEGETLPSDLTMNGCLGLRSIVNKLGGSLFVTKIQIDLLDCNGNVVESSQVGDSREKEYKKVYNLALREAFETFQYLNYKYVPNQDLSAMAIEGNTASLQEKEDQKEIARLKKEVESLKDNKSEAELFREETKVNKVANVTKTKKVEIPKAVAIEKDKVEEEVLYTQPIAVGFQVVDTEPKKVMILLHSGVPDVFIVQGKDAMVYKSDGSWVYAENNGKTLVVKGVNLKF